MHPEIKVITQKSGISNTDRKIYSYN